MFRVGDAVHRETIEYARYRYAKYDRVEFRVLRVDYPLIERGIQRGSRPRPSAPHRTLRAFGAPCPSCPLDMGSFARFRRAHGAASCGRPPMSRNAPRSDRSPARRTPPAGHGCSRWTWGRSSRFAAPAARPAAQPRPGRPRPVHINDSLRGRTFGLESAVEGPSDPCRGATGRPAEGAT